jgi:hypothetical protein
MTWQLLSLGIWIPACEGPAQKGLAQRPMFLQSLLFENSSFHENVVLSEALTKELSKPWVALFQKAVTLFGGVDVLLIESRGNRKVIAWLAAAVRAGLLLCSVLLSAGLL